MAQKKKATKKVTPEKVGADLRYKNAGRRVYKKHAQSGEVDLAMVTMADSSKYPKWFYEQMRIMGFIHISEIMALLNAAPKG